MVPLQAPVHLTRLGILFCKTRQTDDPAVFTIGKFLYTNWIADYLCLCTKYCSSITNSKIFSSDNPFLHTNKFTIFPYNHGHLRIYGLKLAFMGMSVKRYKNYLFSEC
jgi:hypothetical protein